jgi:hypothetical protein
MRLIVPWNVASPRLQALLGAREGCPHCNCDTARLVRHFAGGSDAHVQIWLSCVRCGAKLGGPQPHVDHLRFRSYPVWREGLAEDLLDEEVAELERCRPVSLSELLEALPRERILAHAHHHAITVGLMVGEGATDAIIAEFASLVGPDSYYAAPGFEDGARLVRFAPEGVKVLTPHRRAGDRLDLSDVSILRLEWREPSP